MCEERVSSGQLREGEQGGGLIDGDARTCAQRRAARQVRRRLQVRRAVGPFAGLDAEHRTACTAGCRRWLGAGTLCTRAGRKRWRASALLPVTRALVVGWYVQAMGRGLDGCLQAAMRRLGAGGRVRDTLARRTSLQ